MDWQKSMLQKNIIYYFKYQEFSGIFTINDHISDNSIQINIKFTFTVYEHIIAYEYILLSNSLSLSLSLSLSIVNMIHIINKEARAT